MIILQFFYNLLFPIVFLFLFPFYLPRMFRRGGYRDQFVQRLGIFDSKTAMRIGKGRLWVHAVSVGETFMALKFIRQFRQHHPEARFLLSITTTTALEIAKKQASDWLEPVANPVDFFLITNSIIRKFQPSALIMVEGDVWIQRLLRCKKLAIPIAIITTRLSPRSEMRFRKFRWIIAPLLNAIDLIGVPTLKDQKRWISLGVDPSHLKITGNIKFDQEVVRSANPPVNASEIFSSLGWQADDPVLFAGSTYDLGEEEVLVTAWIKLRQRFPNLRFIIAPRHAERRQEVASLFEKYGINVSLRSRPIANVAEAFILDTTGELSSWYCLATIVFIGKSLGMGSARGGQNPVEPLALGRPVLVGPFMGNFEPMISELLAAEGVLEVKNAEEIVAATERLLLHSEVALKLVENGNNALKIHQGATERTCFLIEVACNLVLKTVVPRSQGNS